MADATETKSSDRWFSAQLRVLCLVEGDEDVMQDESVHIFRAHDYLTAFVRALEIGRGHETEYLNNDGARVRWRLERVLTLGTIEEDDLDGAEVHSQTSDIAGGPSFDTEFHPEEHEPRYA